MGREEERRLPGLFVTAVLSTANSQVYAGISGAGVWVTNDRGETWLPANQGLATATVLAMTRDASGELVAGTSAGAYRSADGGQSWTPVFAGLGDVAVQALVRAAGGTIFAGTRGGGVYRGDRRRDGDARRRASR